MLASESTAIIALFAALAYAAPAPTNVNPRAGAPTPVPIPDSCTITNTLPARSVLDGYIPKESVILNDRLYESYAPSNPAFDRKMCFEQCHGFGDSADCKAAYWAENFPVPSRYYGGSGYATACIMFGRELTEDDFEPAPASPGTADSPLKLATTPYAINLQC
ncbi:uncharacterized protein EI97DRAFT_431054 [Westerdykella ornata]|uniref:Apple domain-containing protein n=1 Tax=Westerdykella ornata TaxID=318751 RepID=A0A6A6JQZ3_WESOR|nr:uncharacterized protein EI97DRAFT_431054 [Westerdykella ornata]KAF2278807.1 hypothetical protein EI97DRAFT_431054 [Westerdykella ornata]